jgi:CelD/BcsL family acetyltransferase involved in cellulose biosynthesis
MTSHPEDNAIPQRAASTAMPGSGSMIGTTQRHEAAPMAIEDHPPGGPFIVGSAAAPQCGAPANPGTWEVIRSPERWDDPALRRDWRSLVEASENPNLMYQSPEWFDHLRQMNDERDLALAVIRDPDGRHADIVPLRHGRDALDFHVAGNTLGTIPLRKVYFLGGRPMTSGDPAVLDRLLEVAVQAFPTSHGLGFAAVRAGDAFWRYLFESRFVNENFFTYIVDGLREYHLLPLPPAFDQYLARYDAKKRYNLRRQLRLFQEHGGGRLELRRIDRPDQIAEYLEAQAALSRRTHGLPDSGSGYDPESFQARNVRSVAERGLLRSYVLYCGDEVAGFIRGDHYLGNYMVSNVEYRPDLAAFSPGVMMLHLAIEDLINHGPTKLVTLGFGEPDRKHHPFNVVQEYGTVLLLRRTLANRLRWLSHRAFRTSVMAAKRWSIRDRRSRSLPSRPRRIDPAAPSATRDDRPMMS